MTTRLINLEYSAFLEMFDVLNSKYSNYNDEGQITLEVKDAQDNNWCCFNWKPEGSTDKWKRMRYNGSSPFAFWWSVVDEELSSEE